MGSSCTVLGKEEMKSCLTAIAILLLLISTFTTVVSKDRDGLVRGEGCIQGMSDSAFQQSLRTAVSTSHPPHIAMRVAFGGDTVVLGISLGIITWAYFEQINQDYKASIDSVIYYIMNDVPLKLNHLNFIIPRYSDGPIYIAIDSINMQLPLESIWSAIDGNCKLNWEYFSRIDRISILYLMTKMRFMLRVQGEKTVVKGRSSD